MEMKEFNEFMNNFKNESEQLIKDTSKKKSDYTESFENLYKEAFDRIHTLYDKYGSAIDILFAQDKAYFEDNKKSLRLPVFSTNERFLTYHDQKLLVGALCYNTVSDSTLNLTLDLLGKQPTLCLELTHTKYTTEVCIPYCEDIDCMKTILDREEHVDLRSYVLEKPESDTDMKYRKVYKTYLQILCSEEFENYLQTAIIFWSEAALSQIKINKEQYNF